MTRSQRWTIVAAGAGSGIVFLDSTVVNVALPQIGRQLPVHLFSTLEALTYVYAGYLLTFTALLILAGALSDFHGRRRMFILGLGAFGFTSVLCGLAPSLEWLICFRLLQGAAGAIVVPGSLALLTAAFSGPLRARAFGAWASVSSATTIAGPFVGGILVDSVSWRAVFLINIPLVAIAIYAAIAHVDESRDEDASGRFDWWGAALIGLAVGALSFGVIYGQARSWQGPVGIGVVMLGLVATAAVPAWMLRREHPLIPPHLFRSRNFAIVNVSTVVIYGALYVVGYTFALFVQGTLGYDAAAAGLAGLLGSIPLVLLSSRVGSLVGRFGVRPFMLAGPLIMAAGVLWWSRMPAQQTAWRFDPHRLATLLPPLDFAWYILPGSLLFGVGIAILVAPLTSALMSSIPTRNAAIGSAINNAVSRIGPQLAGALVFVAVTATFRQSVTGLPSSQRHLVGAFTSPPAGFDRAAAEVVNLASATAFGVAMLIAAGLLILGAAINWFGLEKGPRPGAE